MGGIDYESVGRYVVLCEHAQKKANERNNLLVRIGHVLQGYTVSAAGQKGLARRCNFEAVEKLLDQAKALDAELLEMLDQINQLAPLADKPAVALC